MISMLIYDRIKKELDKLRESAGDHAAYLSDEYWNIMPAQTREQAVQHGEMTPLLNTACMDITGEGDISCVEDFRRKYKEMSLLLIADTSISPMSYVRPGIMASSLLLRPCGDEEIGRVMKEFLTAYMERFETGQSSFVVETREGKLHIPFDKIYYFEAREKKLHIQTDREEYGFYGTIDKLEEELPVHFMRCHRSFIVNTRKIEKIVLSQNIIYLAEGRDVPLSRSYKAALKELG
ncbi:MAG: LytTR family transcriptional regulator [Lachnospiraceae bacterium]|nr:LytTR family transcriptional regulator [Lachnospiraceae bacterium]MBD5504488.1 LytTR family transcriptional regulator [Lachnospiraceae bacterium]